MPTEQELSKAGPLIQELMRDDLAAMRNGKKTREQVGDTAVALAKEAQSPAEKYLLLTAAFDHYMRGGAYDKANSSLAALRTAIPDWKHSDEYSLIEKSLRVLAAGKGGPVRERYMALKERQQYAAKLKKALTQAQAKPADKKLQLQVAAYYAALDHWPQALDAFIAGSSPACAAAAKLEKESAPPAKIADAWWSVVDIRPAFLSSAIRAHAVDLYKKALASNSLAGLQKVAAEKRIAEYESSLVISEKLATTTTPPTSSSTSVGAAKFYGVELIGGLVKESNGVLSGFANNNFAKIRSKFKPGNEIFEVVVEFKTGKSVAGTEVALSCIGQPGFVPFLIANNRMIGAISSNGKTWDIAANIPYGEPVSPQNSYRVKCSWNGKIYEWFIWDKLTWRRVLKIDSATPIFQASELQLGNHRLENAPFSGTIDLTKCYICIGGKLWWEGVKGAYRKANE